MFILTKNWKYIERVVDYIKYSSIYAATPNMWILSSWLWVANSPNSFGEFPHTKGKTVYDLRKLDTSTSTNKRACDGARFKSKLVEVMVCFQLAKNKHQSILRIEFPECRKLQHVTWIHDITRWQTHNNYCTYLNSRLLEAPREYILHGLVPGLNWAPFWPLPMSMTNT
jgi:hypothetical protein